jgi:hypothetical protein
MANYKEINLDQGTDYTETLLVANSVTGQPQDVSTWTFTSQIRKSFYSANVAASFSVVASDTANGVVKLNLSANDSSTLDIGRYVYDIKSVDGSNITVRQQEGIINVYGEVTQ